MPQVLEWQPDIVDRGELRVDLTKDAVWMLFQTVYSLRKRIDALEIADPVVTPGITVSGATMTWIDIDLTANHTVVAPAVAVNAFVVWRFYQNGGSFTVTWPAANFPDSPLVGSTAGKFNYVGMRARPSSKFEIVFAGHQNGTP